MPVTPYHFGPSGFVALIFRKWLDIPVFILANIVIDVEVLVTGGHRYAHTLLLGAVSGVLWGIAAYPLRHFFGKIMQILRLPYQAGFWKMVVSGVLGIWLHVVIDAIYHPDVRIFWPSRATPLWRLISQEQVKIACIGFLVAAVVLYAFTAASYTKQNKIKRENPY
jgi:membrane-bound metal-dependent hydrolase YbcI (DUF457 family)